MTLADLETFDPHARSAGSRRRFLCPLCGRDKPRDATHRSLSLETATGLWLCHRCQAKGKLEGARDERRSRRDRARTPRRPDLSRPSGSRAASTQPGRPILRSPGARGTTPAASPGARPPGAVVPHLSRAHRGLLEGVQPLVGSPAAAYLAERGIPLAVGLAAQAKYHPDFLGHPAVVFAVRDAAERLVAIHGRYLEPHVQPKARSLGPISAGAVAVPLAGAGPRLTGVSPGVLDPTQVPPEPGAWATDPLILVEAPIDALSLATAGWAAVAVLGCNLPDWLPPRLAFRHILIGTDADAAGDKAAAEWTRALRPFGVRVDRFRPEGAVDWNALLQRHGGPALADAVWAGIEERVRQAIEEECGVRVGSFLLPRPRFAILGEE
jgi:hypothetical protein